MTLNKSYDKINGTPVKRCKDIEKEISN